MKIGEREIGVGCGVYVIAEIGVNHDGDIGRALSLTDAAADAGADAVKVQFFETDRLMSKAAKLAAYQKAAGETDPVAMLRRLELSIDEMAQVVDRAHERGIHAIVTVFSVELVEAAETLAWDAYKSASPDIVNRPLLERVMDTGRPMVVSTGASTLDEVVRADGWLGGAHGRVAMLQCVSSYPAPDAALGGIGAIARATGRPVGYSDHTREVETGAHAAARGACVLERHITHDISAKGPDHAASLMPEGFARYAALARDAAAGDPDGEGEKMVLACETDVRRVSRQSVVAARAIPQGATITRDMLTIKRPGTGVLACDIDGVVGTTAARDIENDVPIVSEDLAALERA